MCKKPSCFQRFNHLFFNDMLLVPADCYQNPNRTAKPFNLYNYTWFLEETAWTLFHDVSRRTGHWMPDAVEWWAQAKCPKQPGMLTEKLKHNSSTFWFQNSDMTPNWNFQYQQTMVGSQHKSCTRLHLRSPELPMWCLPLQRLYGFLSRLGTIFGHGSAGLEPLICLTCNILRQVICIHLPLDEIYSIFHKVSFNSKCGIKFTMLDQLLASSKASSSQCSALASRQADMGSFFQRSRSSKLVDFKQVCCRSLYIFLIFLQFGRIFFV